MNEKTGDIPSCSGCIFSTEMEKDLLDLRAEPKLICRRYPPQIMLMHDMSGQGGMISMYPGVAPTSWCGEHEAIDKPLLAS